MKFVRKIAKKLGIIKQSTTDEINEERSEITKTLMKNLKGIGFTDDEVEEVVCIIDMAEAKIQEKKDSLIGTNINNPNVNEDMKKIFQAIRNIQLQMGEDVKAKIAEIKGRKGL